jgi:hypothetical protein
VISRLWSAALMCVAILPAPGLGQEWARKMFRETHHDFGVVARDAKVEHRFVLQNLYEEEVHIVGVRSSCGCATPHVTRNRLKTWESAEVVTVFNTRSFVGQKNSTITVTISRPYYAEVQLDVKGFIRNDVVFEPGSVQFGELDQGAGGQVPIRVSHTGRGDWQILDVRSANPHFEVELSEPRKQGGRVTYQMLVRLSSDAPAGYLNDQLTLITSDATRQGLALAVEGRVRPALTVSPSPLILGVLAPGERITRKVLVRAKTPFRITSVECGGSGCFGFEYDTERAATTHFIPVTFTADPLGRVEEELRIQTDLRGGLEARVLATAEVRELPVSTDDSDR